MAVLFTDLDRTLIYSHRHPVPEGAVWVEELNGKPQSFMTSRSYTYFQDLDWLEVVPLTTRTAAQYGRLAGMAEAFRWQRALICNGAVLLEDGKENPVWTEASRRLVEADRPAWEAALESVSVQVGEDAVVSVPPFLFYVKSEDAEAVFAFLEHCCPPEHLSLFRDARKVYCLPRSLDKGAALRRYLQTFGASPGFAAGDSAFDLPMLEAAEVCFCPASLARQAEHPGKRVCPDGIFFPDAICDGLDALRNEEPSIDRTRKT